MDMNMMGKPEMGSEEQGETEHGKSVTITAHDDGTYSVSGMGTEPGEPMSLDAALQKAAELLQSGESEIDQTQRGYSKGAKPAMSKKPTPGMVFGG